MISRFTPQMFLKMGYGVYFFFASLMILSFVFVFFLVPETKAIPLEQMDRLFATRPIRGAHGVVMDELARINEVQREESDDKPSAAAEEYA